MRGEGSIDLAGVSFGISPECLCHDVRDNVKRVRDLEQAGFDYIWEGDHTLPWQHSSGHSSGIFTTLAAFLANTDRATVGGMVIPALGIRHHPIDVAVGVPPSHHRDVLIPAFEAGAREAGKDPSTMMKCAWVSSSYHPNAEKALDGARVYGGLLIPEAYSYIQDPRVIEQRALLVKDEALRQAFCVASSGEQIIKRFEAFIEAGCNHIL